MHKQRGVSPISLIFVLVALGFVALLAAKLVPAFTEYFAVKTAISGIIKTLSGAPPQEMRTAFEKRSEIENFSSVSSSDLDIAQNGDSTTITLNYEKRVKLFYNTSLLFEFHIQDSNGGAKKAGG